MAGGSKYTIDEDAFLKALRSGVDNGGFSYGTLGGYNSVSNNPFNTRGVGTLAMDNSSVFGALSAPILGLLDGLIGNVGLLRPGYGGKSTPFINLSANLLDRDLSSFHTYMADVNGMASAAASDGSSFAGTSSLNRMLAGNGWRTLKSNNADSGIGLLMDGFSDLMRSEFAPLVDSLLNVLTGQDLGAGASVASARSLDIAGGRMLGGVPGVNSISSSDFMNTRAGLSYMISSGAGNMTWDSYRHRNKGVYGASEALVASIFADALQSGNLDMGEMLRGEGLPEDLVGKSSADIVRAAASKTSEVLSLKERKARLESDLGDAKEGSDEYTRLEGEISEVETALTSASKEADRLNEAVRRGAMPLVESVTKVVDTLKVFYKDQGEAAMALNRLTGGQGSKDRRVAEMVNRQMGELRDTAILAGVSPEYAARHVEDLQSSLMSHGSGFGSGNALSGQLAMSLGQMAFNTMRGMNGDPREQARTMQTFKEFAGSYDQSAANKFSILLESARVSGAIDDSTYQRLYDAGASGDYRTVKRATDELFVRTAGSVEAGRRIYNDPTAMGYFSEIVSRDPDATARAGRFMTSAVMNEHRRLGERYLRSSDMGVAEDRARASGYSASEIRRAEARAAGDAIEQWLGEQEGDGARGILAAYRRKKETLKSSGMDEDAATRAANEWAMNTFVERGTTLTVEQKEQLRSRVDAAATGSVRALESSGLTEADMSGMMGDRHVSRIMREAGAVGGDGTLSAEAFSAAATDAYRAMAENADMFGFNAADIREEAERYHRLMSSGDEGDRQEALRIFASRAAQADTEGNAGGMAVVLETMRDRGRYRTSDALTDERLLGLTDAERGEYAASETTDDRRRELLETAGLTDEEKAEYASEGTTEERRAELRSLSSSRRDVYRRVLGAERYSGVLKGFGTADARFNWAMLQQPIAESGSGIGDLTEEERAEYDRLVEKSGSGEGLTEEEQGRLDRLRQDPRTGRYEAEKERDRSQAQGVRQNTGLVDEAFGMLSSGDTSGFSDKVRSAGTSLEALATTFSNIGDRLTAWIGELTGDAGHEAVAQSLSGSEGDAGGGAEGGDEGSGSEPLEPAAAEGGDGGQAEVGAVTPVHGESEAAGSGARVAVSENQDQSSDTELASALTRVAVSMESNTQAMERLISRMDVIVSRGANSAGQDISATCVT